jgi:HK97 family phage prohead protease
MKREFRIVPHAEVRAKKGKTPGIEGYAAVFNQVSEDLGFFRETIMSGAFTDCLAAKPDVRALFNHNADLVLGRTKARTLSLEEDSKGLHFDCTPPDTQAARDLLTSIERGDVDQCSFGFYVRKQKWSEETGEDGETQLVRELHAIDLFDVSVVTFPAYPQTSVDLRSLWPDGAPADVRIIPAALRADDAAEEADDCECECPECDDGDCANCSDDDCDDPNCKHKTPRSLALPLRGIRGAVSFKKTPASDSDSWDGDAARDRLAKWASSDGSGDKDKMNWSKYSEGFGYVDPDERENFGGYKLPHHDVKDGRLVSVWGGVRAAMTALLGGRGGTSIPSGDRRAVYNHLVKEYKVHDKEAPDFHSLASDDVELRDRLRLRARLAAL